MLTSTFQISPGILVLTSTLTNASSVCTIFKGNAVTEPDLKVTIDDNTLSTFESVTNLGVTLSNNAKWTSHVEKSLERV